MYCKGLKQLKADQKKGISMAIVLCVSAFFIAFAAAIVYTAGLLTAESNHRLLEERCYQLAKSAADVMDKEITSYDQKKDNTVTRNTFYDFANEFLDDGRYLVYNTDSPEATSYRFTTAGTDMDSPQTSGSLYGDGYGNICITLKKELNTDETNPGEGTIQVSAGSDYGLEINNIKNTMIRKYMLVVDVTAYEEDRSYTYTTEYTRQETYDVQFTYKDDIIVWNTETNNWRYGTDNGTVCQMTAGDEIHYRYLTDSTQSCKFIANSYEGGGSTGG